ncbi:threonine aldolase family protein, partial [Bauldia litoralis]|uniref:threonine aldolase family protein n=1 Tax=Bauldia litoralis TaxID=665467 RepID=UPI003297F801
LALACLTPPWGAVFGHEHAHAHVDECGAPEFFSDGAKFVPIAGENGKLEPDAFKAAFRLLPLGNVHNVQPSTLTLTQSTECGTLYSVDEIRALTDIAHSRDIAVHMDGARFAGAVAGLGVSPADVTWKAGVDVLSFGGTKNGCLAAEAVVFFDPAQARDFGFARQRIGHGFSKAWFIAAQFARYLEGDTWLALAGHANARARVLADAVRSSGEARLALEPSANEVLAILTEGLDARLKAAGAIYYPWSPAGMPADALPGPGEVLVRFVTSFQTSEDEVARFAALVSGSTTP